MGKIIVTTFLTLDGVGANPAWSMPFWGDDIGAFKLQELFASEAQLLGRKTYQSFAEAWPERNDEQGFAQRMNTMPKYVVSNTLKQADWQNSTILAGDVVGKIRKLREQHEGDLLVGGSLTLVQTLREHDLIDRYHLLVYPVVLGQGQRLFPEGPAAPELQLISSQTFDSGVVALVYEPVRQTEQQGATT